MTISSEIPLNFCVKTHLKSFKVVGEKKVRLYSFGLQPFWFLFLLRINKLKKYQKDSLMYNTGTNQSLYKKY